MPLCAPFCFNGKQNKTTRNTIGSNIKWWILFLESTQDPLITHTIFRLQSINVSLEWQSQSLWDLFIFFVYWREKMYTTHAHTHTHLNRIHFPGTEFMISIEINQLCRFSKCIFIMYCVRTHPNALRKGTQWRLCRLYISCTHTIFYRNNNNTEFFSPEIHSIIKYILVRLTIQSVELHSNRNGNRNRRESEERWKKTGILVWCVFVFVCFVFTYWIGSIKVEQYNNKPYKWFRR